MGMMMMRIDTPPQHIRHRHDHVQTRRPFTDDPPEAEQHALFVLLHDAKREGRPDQHQHQHPTGNEEQYHHVELVS
jgi:hypothetical protein